MFVVYYLNVVFFTTSLNKLVFRLPRPKTIYARCVVVAKGLWDIPYRAEGQSPGKLPPCVLLTRQFIWG